MRSLLRPSFRELTAWFALGQAAAVTFAGNSPAGKMSGRWTSAFRGQGMLFEAVREYLPGDEARHIDWSVTARTGKPHLKLFREERQQQLVIAVDDSASMQFGTRGTFKNAQAAHIAAMLAGSAIAEHEQLGCGIFNTSPAWQWFGMSSRRQNAMRFLKALTLPPDKNVGKLDGAGLPAVIRNMARQRYMRHGSSICYIISDFAQLNDGDELKKSLNELRRQHKIVLIAVDDQADFKIAPVGVVPLGSDDKSPHPVLLEKNKAAAVFADIWLKRRNVLRLICRELGIRLLETTTAENVKNLQLLMKQAAG